MVNVPWNGRHPVGAIRQEGAGAGGGENWKRMGETVVSGGDEPTKVRNKGNTVLVPVTLAYGGYDVNVHLVLDTGASKTTINTEVAEQLTLDLSRAKKARVQVAGGAVLEARMVKMNSVTVGPYTNATGIYSSFPIKVLPRGMMVCSAWTCCAGRSTGSISTSRSSSGK